MTINNYSYRPLTRNRTALLILITGLVLLSCRLFSGQSNDDITRTYGVDRETAVFLASGQPQTLDPALTHGGPDGVLGHVFSGLVTLDTNLQVQPDLAAGWQISDDGTVYTFYLQPNAVFHDGRPVTAADVISSWERAAAPLTGSDTAETYLGDIVGVDAVLDGRAEQIAGLRAIDEQTLEVRIDAPKPYFLAKLTYPVAFVVDSRQVDEADWEHQANGTGPFKLATWEDDQIIVLARNEAFYRPPEAAAGAEPVAHVVYLMGAGIPLSLYETDQIDLVGIGGSTLERVLDPNNPLSQELLTGVSMCTSTISFNTRTPPFDDVRVRQAFNYALDKERLIETLAGGNALVADGPLPPGMPGYETRPSSYPFDPARARALLAEAGYEAGLPLLTYYASGYGDVGPLVTAAVTLWQEHLGAEIKVLLLEPFTYYDELYGGNVGDLFTSGWCADYPDPQNFLDILYHSRSAQNLGGYSNPTLDRLLEQARVEPDTGRRLALYAQIEAVVIEEVPVVFVNHDLAAVLVKPRLEGYVFTPIGVPQWHRVQLR